MLDGNSASRTFVSGPAGRPGQSAYQAWLDAGHVGTQAQFLASLKGAQGVPGPPGGNSGAAVSRTVAAPGGFPKNTAVVDVGGGQCVPADPREADHCGQVIGFVDRAVSFGFVATITPLGPFADLTENGFDEGDFLYISDGTDGTHLGGLTSTIPSLAAGHTWIQTMGRAVSATAVNFERGIASLLFEGAIPYSPVAGYVLPGKTAGTYAEGDDPRIVGAITQDGFGQIPYVGQGGTVPTPLYLRKTLARIDLENHCRASDPNTHFEGWRDAFLALAASGGGSIRAPDAEFVLDNVMQTSLHRFTTPNDASTFVLDRKGFGLLLQAPLTAPINIEIALHRDTRIVAGANIRSDASGPRGTSTVATDLIKSAGSLIGLYMPEGYAQGANRNDAGGRASRYECAFTGGRIIMDRLVGNATGLDGLTISGAWDRVTVDTVIDCGTTAPTIDTSDGTPTGYIGTGGGDSGLYLAGCRNADISLYAVGCADLAVYVSQAGGLGELCTIRRLEAYRCGGILGVKRNFRRTIVHEVKGYECSDGIFGGSVDGTEDHGKEFQVRSGYMRHMAGNPFRFDNNVGIEISGVTVEDWGRCLADPTIPTRRSNGNQAGAVKFNGVKRSAVRNCQFGFKDWAPSLVDGRQAVGVQIGTFNGIPTSGCQFDCNRFYGQSAANGLYADYDVAEACTDNAYDRVPQRSFVLNTDKVRAHRSHGRAIKIIPTLQAAGTAQFVSYSLRSGAIRLEGEHAHVEASVYLSTKGDASGDFVMLLPAEYQAYSGDNAPAGYPLTLEYQNVTLPAGLTHLTAVLEPGGRSIRFIGHNSTTGASAVAQCAWLSDTARLTVSGTFRLAAPGI